MGSTSTTTIIPLFPGNCLIFSMEAMIVFLHIGKMLFPANFQPDLPDMPQMDAADQRTLRSQNSKIRINAQGFSDMSSNFVQMLLIFQFQDNSDQSVPWRIMEVFPFLHGRSEKILEIVIQNIPDHRMFRLGCLNKHGALFVLPA